MSYLNSGTKHNKLHLRAVLVQLKAPALFQAVMAAIGRTDNNSAAVNRSSWGFTRGKEVIAKLGVLRKGVRPRHPEATPEPPCSHIVATRKPPGLPGGSGVALPQPAVPGYFAIFDTLNSDLIPQHGACQVTGFDLSARISECDYVTKP